MHTADMTPRPLLSVLGRPFFIGSPFGFAESTVISASKSILCPSGVRCFGCGMISPLVREFWQGEKLLRRIADNAAFHNAVELARLARRVVEAVVEDPQADRLAAVVGSRALAEMH